MAVCLFLLAAAYAFLTIDMKFHPVASVIMISVQILDIPFLPLLPHWYVMTLCFN